MLYRSIGWLATGVLILISVSCSNRQAEREDLSEFIDDYEKKIEYVERRLAEEQWEYYTHGYSDSLTVYRDLYGDLHADPDRLKRIKSQMTFVDDPAAKRRLEIVYRHFLRGVVSGDPAVDRLVDSLVMMRRVRPIVFEGSSTSVDGLRDILRNEASSSRRRSAFAVLTSPDEDLVSGLASLARIRNQIVARFGYNSYYDLMLLADGVDKSDLNDMLRRLDEWSQDAYRAMLDSLKTSIGVDDPGVWDIEYALYAAEREARAYVPADGQKSLAEASVGGLGMELAGMPIYFAEQASSVQTPLWRVLPVHVPDDIRAPMYTTDGIPSMRRLLHQVGEAVYFAHIERTDALLARPPAPCFRYGMAEMIAHFVTLDGWMRKYAGLPEPIVVQLRASYNAQRLYRLRLALTRILFEKQLYANPSADIAAAYRTIFENYMLISAEGASIPLDLIMEFITAPVEHQNRLIGEGIRAHVYQYLRDRYGSVLDNQRTREFLVHNFYRFGALDDWKTLVQRGTGEPLDISHLIINSDN